MTSVVITSVSPKAGPVASQVTVSGAGFGTTQGTSTISFNNTAATVSTWGDTQIVATVPSGATTGAVKVVKGGVNSNIDVVFSVGAVALSRDFGNGDDLGSDVCETRTFRVLQKPDILISYRHPAAA